MENRQKRGSIGGGGQQGKGGHRFDVSQLRSLQQPELSKKLFKIIKTENHAINSYEAAGRDRISVASQLSEWGEGTGDYAIYDLSDKLGVLMAEIGEQEDLFAQGLEDSRSVLKHIRNTESSVQPARDHKNKIIDEIHKLKQKDPGSQRVTTLEQELVRAEAQALVAEAQLTNMTRQKFKEAYDLHLAATIERAEKQLILARYGRRLLTLLDDVTVVPGEQRGTYEHEEHARRMLEEAEQDLKGWEPHLESIAPISGGGEGGHDSGVEEEVGSAEGGYREKPVTAGSGRAGGQIST